jgi:SOS-response transcriptional repressor LexA
MDDTVERLQWLRRKADLASRADAARAYGINYETYKKLENPDDPRSLTREHAETIASYHHVSKGWLMFGEGTPEGETQVQLKGFIGAGQEVTLFEDIQDHHEMVDGIIAGPDTFALEVRGESMFPLAHNRDLIFVGPPRRKFEDLIGYECAVQLQDGRHFFKIIERGSRPHLFDLRSYNAEPMRDLDVHSAGMFLGVQRRRGR